MKSGVATRPIADLKAYRAELSGLVYRSGAVMQPLFDAATDLKKRIVYAEGEDDRVLRAAQIIADEKLAFPILVGRPEVIQQKIDALGLRISAGRDFEIAPLGGDDDVTELAEEFYKLRRRDGVSRSYAEAQMLRNATLFGAMLVRRGAADGLLCGISGSYGEHLKHVREVIGLAGGARTLAAMNLLMLPESIVFLCDTQINVDPSAEQLVEITLLAAAEVRRFGVTPHVAMLSHSSFGSSENVSAQRMREAAAMLWKRAPDLEVEGEMQGDAALTRAVRDRVFPQSRLSTDANLLMMPSLDAANITLSCLRVVSGQGVTVGPILLGAAKPVHILLPTTTVRGIVNMTAVTAAEVATHD